MFEGVQLPVTATLIAASYIVIYLIDRLIMNGTLLEWGGGKSFNKMERNEWYRLVTGTFFHSGIIHLAANTIAIYFAGLILESLIGSWTFLFIYLFGNIGASIVYAKFSSFTHGTGASPGIYALIACVIILHIQYRETFDLNFEEWPVSYMFFYAILGNFIGIGGLIVHVLGFVFGLIAVAGLLLLNITL